MENRLPTITQIPPPGERQLRFKGDTVTFYLKVEPATAGCAFVRTNIGHAAIIRKEIINWVERNEPILAREWFDIAMTETGPGKYEAVIGLNEVGHFEAKCLFIAEGRSEPLWPRGPNSAVNVEPAHTCCANIIYNAFVRQFGPNKGDPVNRSPVDSRYLQALDRAGYTAIPPSGTFRDLIAELDFIMERLGCRYIQLLPIHPTPTTYGRMGRFGSPYAALSFTEVDPALAVFDPKATPLEQFLELVDAVHARSGKLLIDMAINHTGWAARLHATHPQWLARDEEGQIQNPGAWGVVWEDLTHLDYGHKQLWRYMANALLTWCGRGVDGFRCDAGYMIPVPAWQYMIAIVRDQYPDTVFFLEGLGGKVSVTRDLLNRANFNWAYSELFQNYDRSQIEHYLPEAIDISASEGITVHFAETHDNNRLAQTSETYARMRTALCALLAPFGAFAFANGVEWLATQKINVHDACSLNWGATENQVDAIGRLAVLLKTHPAFGPSVALTIISRGPGNFIALLRRHEHTRHSALVVANLDWEEPVTAGWDRQQISWDNHRPVDLLSGRSIEIHSEPERQFLILDPGQVLCLAEAEDADVKAQGAPHGIVQSVVRQSVAAKALEVLTFYESKTLRDLNRAADELMADPVGFCRRLNPHSDESRVIVWDHGADVRRQVMVPPGHFVLVRAPHHFQVRMFDHDRVMAAETSLWDSEGQPFALLQPLRAGAGHRLHRIELSVYAPGGVVHTSSQLLYLSDGRNARVNTAFNRPACDQMPLLALGTDGRGAMMRVHSDWSRLESRYDALLAANINPYYPEDRRILFTRCRAWIVYQGYSQEVHLDCLERFAVTVRGAAIWDYQIPTGQGEHIRLQICARMLTRTANTVQVTVRRLESRPDRGELDDAQTVQLILRPDIEDRNFHHTTKAFTGPEHHWPQAIKPGGSGFVFQPSPDYGLWVHMENGRFISEPEWHYMVHRPQEALRGLDADSDLFSPGYFSSRLPGGGSATLTARAANGTIKKWPEFLGEDGGDHHSGPHQDLPLEAALRLALEHYVVRRGNFRTVIAGYPWFLDWGRDTLIAARGLVAAGRWDTVIAILKQFAGFEANGTLPNMIRGDDAGNRDTSDAPLWLFTVCADLSEAAGNSDFLFEDCGGRSLKQVLVDMAGNIMAGTPNGVTMDKESGLIFSPSHYTWMDTNFPAGTPRQGYPIEIQALWHAALRYLAGCDTVGTGQWQALAEKVRNSIQRLFWKPSLGYLSDCLHARPGQGAGEATADDALRPNQLLAITMGAVSDKSICMEILDACQSLLVPGAIRSLADRPVKIPQPVVHDRVLLNDPLAPYWGTYTGDEDTRRKPAYHNGTAWTWPFPSYCEAWVSVYGPAGIPAARSWLSSAVVLIHKHCVGHLPEILDGDAPHAQRGCDAQAWGASELLRVWLKVKTAA